MGIFVLSKKLHGSRVYMGKNINATKSKVLLNIYLHGYLSITIEYIYRKCNDLLGIFSIVL